MLSILKLDSILLTLLSTVIRVSFPLSLSQKGICFSIVYHKTLHLYYKFPYSLFLPLYNTVIQYFAILYEVCKLITKYLPALVNQAFPPLSVIYFSSTTWKMKNLIIVFHLVLSLFLVVPNTHFSLFYISSHYIICY
mgnify:FL=1